MTFLKLDTRVIAGFDAALAPDIVVVSVAPWTVLRSLAARRGWGYALTTKLRSVFNPGADARRLVAGNIDRKRIRLPALFGNSVVAGIYGRIKAGQAAVLKDVLQAELDQSDPSVVIIFNGSLYPESVLAEVSKDRRRAFVEGGFFPGTMQVDPKGLNAANSVPRDPGFYLDAVEDFAADGLPDAVNNRASKTQGAGAVDLKPGYVFVPFQVPSDMQVTLHSPWVRDMEMFQDVICDLADRHPDETFVIKEHPSFKRSVKGRRSHPRVIFANDNVTSDLIDGARAVITLNSTVGIEALYLERPVITLGHACYDIEGLVLPAHDAAALDNALIRTRDWRPDERLRRQFLGYLWNRYLVRGTYNALPDDLSDQVLARV